MDFNKSSIAGFLAVLVFTGLVAFGARHLPDPDSDSSAARSYIVQGKDVALVALLVQQAGGRVQRELDIINAVKASLTPRQREVLKHTQGIRRIFVDAEVKVAGFGSETKATHYASQVGADLLHLEGIDGSGVTVAILDSGLWPETSMNRVFASYDALQDTWSRTPYPDQNGHGTHIASIIASSRQNLSFSQGIAPAVELVIVKAFDREGVSSYSDTIAGINWIIEHNDKLGVDVLNLSMSAQPQSHYWDDPLNQAVMAAWEAGIVVVAAAGNGGPDPMTIGVPGNVPYVVTVGAMTDNFTPNNPKDDRLADFSAAGPTHEGFVKPDVVAPGGHMLGLIKQRSWLVHLYPEYYDAGYFEMSGTSQATAVVSGIAALILQANPNLTPDQVKCRITAAARPAVNERGDLAYSVFQQGAGRVDAFAAVFGTDQLDCANQGLDISADLAGVQHFGGRANRKTTGEYFLMEQSGDGSEWKGGAPSASGYLWTDGYLWSNGYLWSEGYLWTDAEKLGASGYLWTDGYLWTEGYLWTNGYLWTEGYLWTAGYLSTEGFLWNSSIMLNGWVAPQ